RKAAVLEDVGPAGEQPRQRLVRHRRAARGGAGRRLHGVQRLSAGRPVLLERVLGVGAAAGQRREQREHRERRQEHAGTNHQVVDRSARDFEDGPRRSPFRAWSALTTSEGEETMAAVRGGQEARWSSGRRSLVATAIVLALAGGAAGQTPALFPITVNDKHGMIDRAGKEVIPPEYAEPGVFRDGLARVGKGA